MSDDEPTRRRYAGRGVGELRTARERTTVLLPSKDDATLLPDPRAAFKELRAKFIAANGRVPGTPEGHNRPLLRLPDINAIGNFVTFALHNDLIHFDVTDAAVIWEQWRRAVGELRALLRHATDTDAQYIANGLEHRLWNTEDNLQTALRSPGAAYESYCPWRQEWATEARLYPGGRRFW